MCDDFLVVVSHYAARDTRNLKRLLSEISPFVKKIVISINSDDVSSEHIETFEGYPALMRPNTGMNLGGWWAAYLKFPLFKYYLFLQDECSLLNIDFIEAYKYELNSSLVGMTGESINYKWDKSWGEMLYSPLNYQTDVEFEGHRVSRVELYLRLMIGWGVNPGISATHLRSLIWAFKGSTLSKLKSFPIGLTKEECIAAEIAVSKQVEELGLGVSQISETPFSFFRHDEWRSDGVSKI